MNHSENIAPYIIPFAERLKTIDHDIPGLDNYCKAYLAHLLQHSRYYTEIYSQVLAVLLTHSEKEKSSITLVDYGAGNGLLGLFAKFCGFKKVYINDINESFIKAATSLSLILNIPVDGFITGDISDVKNYFNVHDRPTAIAGTDVIEHVYNLNDLFKGIRSLNENMVTVFTTGANAHNWFKAKAIKKQQLFDEYTGGALAENILSGSGNSPAFFITRKEIIQSVNAELNEEEITMLAKATRGMMKADIIDVTNLYITDKKIPALPRHPSNTCDPLSGSWAERLLTIDEYKQIYRSAGFELKQYDGFYNSYEHTFKSLLLRVANGLITVGGKTFAPAITIAGFSKK